MPMIIPQRSFEVADWAALLALTGVPDGRVYTVLAPVITGGTVGTCWARDSGSLSGWRPAGRQVLYRLPAPVFGVAGGSTADQMLRAVLTPTLLLAGCSTVHVATLLDATGTNDAVGRNVSIRLGGAGTTADPRLGYMQFNGGSLRGQSVPAEFCVLDGTTVIGWGPSGLRNSGQLTTPWASGSRIDNTASVTVPSVASAPMYVSVSVQQQGSPTAQMSLQNLILEAA